MSTYFSKSITAQQPIDVSRSNFFRTMCACVLIAMTTTTLAGCSTLASLGLPVGKTGNEIVDSAKRISEHPGKSLLLPNEFSKQPLPTYVLQIGDTVFVEPVSFDSTIRLPGDQVIKPDGSISIGEFGSFMAVDKTIEQIQVEVQSIIDGQLRQRLEDEFAQEQMRAAAERAIAERPELESSKDDDADDEDQTSLANDADAADKKMKAETARANAQRAALNRRIDDLIRQNRISARLVGWDSQRIYVLGEVNSPGFFNFIGNETVLDAIVEAGGLNSKANHHQIIITRPSTCNSCRKVMKVCYDQIVQVGDTSTNYQLMPGDRVFVPSLTFWDDLKMSLSCNKEPRCPRCADCQRGCEQPTGCQ